MEINKMLTVSTGHISKETAELLDKDNIYGLVVYQKDEYGWFIFLSEEDDYYAGIPDELLKLIKFAKDLGCSWLCLDRDGDVLEYLEVFDW